MNSKNIESKAQWLRKYKIRKAITATLIAILAIIIVAIMVISVIFNSFGSFTISVKRLEMAEYGITLSEHRDSYQTISRLNAKPLEESDATSADDIDALVGVGDVDGSNNGEKYMQYTFYCINAGSNYDITYSYALVIKNVTKNLDEAIRVKLFVDDKVVGVYGKQEKDGNPPLRDYDTNKTVVNGEEVYDRSEENTIKKFSGNTVAYGEIENFKPKQTTKFTILMWIEGTDPQCNDDLLYGTIRLDMNMSIIHAEEIKDK